MESCKGPQQKRELRMTITHFNKKTGLTRVKHRKFGQSVTILTVREKTKS